MPISPLETEHKNHLDTSSHHQVSGFLLPSLASLSPLKYRYWQLKFLEILNDLFRAGEELKSDKNIAK